MLLGLEVQKCLSAYVRDSRVLWLNQRRTTNEADEQHDLAQRTLRLCGDLGFPKLSLHGTRDAWPAGMGARLLARAGSDVGEGEHQRADNLESARLSDLYATAIRESAGRLGCVWVVGRENTSRNLPGSIDGIPPLLPPAHEMAETLPALPPPLPHHRHRHRHREAETIPVDVDLKEMSSGPRPIITSRHRRESLLRIQQAQLQAMQPPPSEPPTALMRSSYPPPLPMVPARSLLAEVSAPRRPRAKGGILQMMAITTCTTFLLIVIALFVAEYRGMPVHAMIESTGHAIAHVIRQWLASLT